MATRDALIEARVKETRSANRKRRLCVFGINDLVFVVRRYVLEGIPAESSTIITSPPGTAAGHGVDSIDDELARVLGFDLGDITADEELGVDAEAQK